MSWFRGSDWGIAREASTTSPPANCSPAKRTAPSRPAAWASPAFRASGQPLRPLRFEQRRGRGAGPLRLVCDGLHARLCHPPRSDDPDNPYTLIDLASGEKTAVQRSDTDYHSGNVAVLTANNVLKIYDGTTGALLTDVEVTPVEEGHYVSLTALPDATPCCNTTARTTTPLPSRPTAAMGCSGRPPVRPSSTPTPPTSPTPPTALCSRPTGTTATRRTSPTCWTWRAICFSAASAAATASTIYPTTALSRGRASTTADGLHRPVALPRKHLLLPQRRRWRGLPVLTRRFLI